MKVTDIEGASDVHRKAFPRQHLSVEWMQCTYAAFPRTICYVAEKETSVVGYIVWAQKSGFRPEVVLELEQIAVAPEFQNKGYGKELIESSLKQVKNKLKENSATVKHILVTTRHDNRAQRLYEKCLGAQQEAILSDLYSADEVIMIARNV